MDTVVYLLKGIIIGFSIAAPVGPIGILCIHRSLAHGRLHGFVSGLGAATADAVYGIIAGFGLTVVSNFLIGQKFWIQLFGGIFLCYLGIKTLRSKPNTNSVNVKGDHALGAYTSIFFLTITNPMTILLFAGIFAGLGLSSDQGNALSSVLLVLGVFLGSAFWWLLLSIGANFFKNKLTSNLLVWVNRLSGFIVLTFGIWALTSSII